MSPAQDDVFTLVPPGASKTYVYDVPKDHARGTFWYHPHARGSSGLQAAMMHGALVVEEADPVDDVVLLLGQYNLVAGKPRNYAWACVESQPIQDTFNLSVSERIFGGSLSSRRELGERIRTVQESWETSSI